VKDGEAVAPERSTQANPERHMGSSAPFERSDESKNIVYDGRMIGIVAIILGLVYLGHILSFAWAQKPLGPYDFVLLAPLISAGLALWYSKARKQHPLATSTTPKSQPVPQRIYADVLGNWLFENDDAEPIEGLDGANRENEDTRRLGEDFFYGRYHWWGNR
jgi:hypothetical protein